MHRHLLSVNSSSDLYGESADQNTDQPIAPPLTPVSYQHQGRSPAIFVPSSVYALDFSTVLSGEISISELLLTVFLFLSADLETLRSITEVSRGWLERAEYLPQWGLLMNFLQRPKPPMRAIVMNWLWDVPEISSPSEGIQCRADFIQRRQTIALQRRKLRTTRMFFQANSVLLGVVLSFLYGATNASALWFGYYVGFDRNVATDKGLAYNYLLGVLSLFGIIVIAYSCMSCLLSGPYKWLARASRSIVFVSVLIPLFVGLGLTLACARLCSVEDLCDHPEIDAGLCRPISANSTLLTIPSVVSFINASEWSFVSQTAQIISAPSPAGDAEYVYYVMWIANTARPLECPGRVALFVQQDDNISTISWNFSGLRKFRTPVPSRFFQVDPLAIAHVSWYSLPFWTVQRFPAIVAEESDLPQVLLPVMKSVVWCIFVVAMITYVVACVVVWKKLVKLVQLVGQVLE